MEEFDPSHARRLHREAGRAAAVDYLSPFLEHVQPRAMIAMADLEYDEGNFEASVGWMRRAEDAIGDADMTSATYLASAYQQGLGGGTPDELAAKALAVKERVADSGNVVMQHALMATYLHGLNGAQVSKERFAYWAARAAELGSKEAAHALRSMDKWPDVT